MKPRTIKLFNGEHIVAVVPENCSGPGWSNSPVWVFIESNDGKLRRECLQPKEQSPELINLFDIGAIVCRKLAEAVKVDREPFHSDG